MSNPRICLIVDNPLRDLDGMVLLGWTLAQQGAEVYLVPMYQQSFEVAALSPDFVLVNHLRRNNAQLVKAYADSGILVGVLDTEGGIFNSVEEGLIKLVARSYPENVDLYCLWGKKQYESFLAHKLLPREKLAVTGCPRYDFCSLPWKQSLSFLQHVKNPMILINTRFSLIFPRFQKSYKEEIKVMLSLGFKDDYVREYARQCFLVWAEMIGITAELAKTFSSVTFVVRPHPFEDRTTYDQLLKDIPNVRIIQEGTVLPWIHASSLLVQRDCSTALEASFLNKPVLSLEWIHASLLHNEFISSISYAVPSKERLFAMVHDALSGKPCVATNEMIQTKENLVNDWFYAIDGKSSQRVSQAILNTIAREKGKLRKKRTAKLLNYNGFTPAGLKSIAYLLGTRTLGTRRFDQMKSALLKVPASISKEFDAADVQNVVDSIARVAHEKSVTVETVKNKHSRLKMIAKYSIRLST